MEVSEHSATGLVSPVAGINVLGSASATAVHVIASTASKIARSERYMLDLPSDVILNLLFYVSCTFRLSENSQMEENTETCFPERGFAPCFSGPAQVAIPKAFIIAV